MSAASAKRTQKRIRRQYIFFHDIIFGPNPGFRREWITRQYYLGGGNGRKRDGGGKPTTTGNRFNVTFTKVAQLTVWRRTGPLETEKDR